MSAKFDRTSGRLRVTQAYIALSAIPGSGSEPKTVSIVRIGKCEIRMFNSLPNRSGDTPLLWIELFDHDARLPIDSCSCREIDDAMSAFDDLVSQANNSNGVRGLEADDAKV